MKDFTLDIYKQLLMAFLQAGYSFFTFEQFCKGEATGRFVILRHDVDLKAMNSYHTAVIENELGIAGSYYFRIISQSNKPDIIKKIISLGHEIGYHYEDLSLFNGNKPKAIEHFEDKLSYFRQYYPVKTICMHGSPTSRIDNRSIWQEYNYKDFGIIGEPYFDVDFNEMLYITDTGRSWDGERFSVRDKVKSDYDFHFKSTNDIINTINQQHLPNRIMITTHPQRWTNNVMEWSFELISQSVKNKVKQFLVK